MDGNNTPKVEHHHVTYALSLAALVVGVLALGGMTFAGTVVPGHQKQIDKNIGGIDSDGNGIPDEGYTVSGKYTSLYAYDENGDWYWDLGDGRVHGTVSSVDELDGETLTQCDYQVQYRGAFDNDPFLDSGWITNNINCRGHDDDNKYNYFIVHETDPRYRGNPEWSIWGTWEYHGLVISGQGNLVRPMTPVGSNF